MIDHKILAVKNSWSYMLMHTEEAGEVFYQKLFELEPALYPLFKGNIQSQAKKLMEMITLMVARLQKLEDIREEIKDLGKRHVAYGTQPEHYQAVGKALLWTLQEKLDTRWTDEMQDAWTEVYLIFANIMLNTDNAVNKPITKLQLA